MLITCPTCAAVYRIDDGAIGPKGRNVQCDACGAQWRQAPKIEVAEDVSETPVSRNEAAAGLAETRPKTPGLEEAAELLHEMREESARTDSSAIFGDEAANTGESAIVEAKKAEELAVEKEVRSIIASANKKSPSAEKRKGGGFRVGFIVALMFVAALAFAYLANDLLADQFPGAASILSAYADAVDMIRGSVEKLAAGVMKDDGLTLQ